MGRSAPPSKGCALAWRWRSRGATLERTRQELLAEGFDVSIPTVSDWADRGAEAEEYLKFVEGEEARLEEYKALDRTQARWILASTLDEMRAMLWDQLDLATPQGERAKPHLEVMDLTFKHFKWILEMRAKVTNAWAPPHATQVTVDGIDAMPRPPQALLDAVAAFMKQEEANREA
jgi:hypothetical protein